MNQVALSLVVLRSSDMEKAVAFYRRLGLTFDKHRHGNGPEHFSAEVCGSVLEIYPASVAGASTLGTRIGFRVPSVDAAVATVSSSDSTVVISAARDSEWGRRAVVVDPDGHRVELVEEGERLQKKTDQTSSERS